MISARQEGAEIVDSVPVTSKVSGLPATRGVRESDEIVLLGSLHTLTTERTRCPQEGAPGTDNLSVDSHSAGCLAVAKISWSE